MKHLICLLIFVQGIKLASAQKEFIRKGVYVDSILIVTPQIKVYKDNKDDVAVPNDSLTIEIKNQITDYLKNLIGDNIKIKVLVTEVDFQILINKEIENDFSSIKKYKQLETHQLSAKLCKAFDNIGYRHVLYILGQAYQNNILYGRGSSKMNLLPILSNDLGFMAFLNLIKVAQLTTSNQAFKEIGITVGGLIFDTKNKQINFLNGLYVENFDMGDKFFFKRYLKEIFYNYFNNYCNK